MCAPSLFCSLSLRRLYQVFFQHEHQMKTITIGIFEANPLAELVDCSPPLHSICILSLNSRFLSERATP